MLVHRLFFREKEQEENNNNIISRVAVLLRKVSDQWRIVAEIVSRFSV